MYKKNNIPIINPNDEPTTLMGLALNSKGHKKNFAKSKIFVPNQKLIVSNSGNKIPESPYPYKAVMCPHCGRIQVTTGEVCFRCRICSKTSSYRRNGKPHVKFKDFPTHEMACIFAKRWSEGLTK